MDIQSGDTVWRYSTEVQYKDTVGRFEYRDYGDYEVRMNWTSDLEYLLRQLIEDNNGKLAKNLVLSFKKQNDRSKLWNMFTIKYYNACGFKESDGKENNNKEDIWKKWSFILQS